MDEVLYKYRSLDNFRHFVDIIFRRRLYAAKYKDLNDPMEGQYYYSGGKINIEVRRKLRDKKAGLRLCSLSRDKDNYLMWSHYANGHRGVVIGVRITDTSYIIEPIKYSGIESIIDPNVIGQTALEILSHKLQVWNYEKEVRVFTRNECYVNIEVVEVIAGVSMDITDFNFIRDLIEKIDSKIKVRKAESKMKNL